MSRKRKYSDYLAVLDTIWMQHYEVAKHYYEKYGTLPNNPKVIYENFKLGFWLHNQKCYYRQGRISKERIELLEKLDIVWIRGFPSWDDFYQIAKQYYEEYGHLLLSQDEVYHSINLGKWVHHQRDYYKNKKLSSEQVNLLEQIGMVWKLKQTWEESYQLCVLYYKEYGHLKVTWKEVYKGFNLGSWVKKQREKYKQGRLSMVQISKLEEIGMLWKTV